MKKTALITGVHGQDGTYLAKLLTAKGYRVVGTSRSPRAHTVPGVEVLALDLGSQEGIDKVIKGCAPNEIYNFASFSTGVGMYDAPLEISDINGMAVTRILEAIRKTDPEIRFCQASSREIFGSATTSPQNELTERVPRNPYGAAKLYADNMIRVYRDKWGMFACSAILFNHESSLRTTAFVTRKITSAVAKIRLGQAKELQLEDLEAIRDWGFAGDYINAMWMMLQAPKANDYVVASGEGHTVGDFCKIAFEHVDLDYRSYVKVAKNPQRAVEVAPLIGDPTRLKQLGWQPQVSFTELVRMMVDADLELLTKI